VILLLGVGAGLAFPSLMTLAMSAATPEDSGLASGLVNTTQQVGGALGLAVLATLSSTRAEHLLAHGGGFASSLTSGYHLVFTVGTVLVTIAIALAVAFLPGKALIGAEERDMASIAEAAYLEEAA
jgi:MFS family permease